MENISHKGHIIAIMGTVIDVSVEAQAACVSCTAKGLCGDNGKSRIISVYNANANLFRVGDEVTVSMAKIMGLKAVLWAYIAPIFIMFAALVGVSKAGYGEMVAGGAALGTVALYYVALYFFRDRIKKEIIFKITL